MHWTSVFCALAARHIRTCSFREVRSNANEASTCKVGANQLSMSIKPRLHFEMLIAACYDSHNPPKPLARFVSVQCLNALEYFLHSLATRFIDLTSDDDSTAPGNAPAPVTLFASFCTNLVDLALPASRQCSPELEELSVHSQATRLEKAGALYRRSSPGSAPPTNVHIH